ncbi:hypothetical protein Y88_1721 [Novosphingobium nitrogenifigens DSM 19370]|uniref:Chitooligosaccharide deacetylase n=1 Tax=Novosphingobium nitrogenifigens DSM 19370 TaxID=983920 RepID=F1Z3L9_9SPHN|nr:hypothetical protein Y88_1721 [Novosphingobium nitrogenifigens DSM 19370]
MSFHLSGSIVQNFKVRFPRLSSRFRIKALAAGTAAVVLAAFAPVSAHAGAPKAPRASVALTFDDLPGIVLKPEQGYVDETNEKLLERLHHYHFPAIGFVNEGKLDEIVRERQIANLERWIKAGHDLGNHTFSHGSPNALGAEGYIADIARGERVIRPMMEKAHRRLQWFRHPYLETGSPAAVKDRIDAWLTAHGYRIAPVTIDCDDWEFAEPYDEAVMTGNKAQAERIRNVYLAYTERTIGWYRKGARVLFGRDISYVMLLHDTRLNADSLDGLAAIFKRQNMKPVALDKAMRDPAYKTPDGYQGKDGIEWLERWSLALHKDLPWNEYEEVPKPISEEYNKLDNR